MKNNLEFLLVIAFAVFIKQVLSPFHSIARAFSTALAAVFCAYVFTDPVCSILRFDDDRTRLAVAAVLGLTGEHIIRHIIDTGQDPDRGISRLKSVMLKVFELAALCVRGPAAAPPPATPAKPPETEKPPEPTQPPARNDKTETPK